mmetsp:Transcript_25052/g.48934  ORF Transcript_25052/g.48934 Transcript_25052/m.48934 type:complete len:155 (+) Transcript_25052:133-597(+)
MASYQSQTDTSSPNDVEMASISDYCKFPQPSHKQPWSFRKTVIIIGSLFTLSAFAIVGFLLISHYSSGEAGMGDGFLMSGSGAKFRNHMPERVSIDMTAHWNNLNELAFNDDSVSIHDTEADPVVANLDENDSLYELFVEEHRWWLKSQKHDGH